MKKSEWNEGLNHLDYDLVEKYVEQKDMLEHKKKTKSARLRFAAIAACFALVLSAAFVVVPMLWENDTERYIPSGEPWSPVIPSNVDNVVLSADELDGFMNGLGSYEGSTNQYTEVYANAPQFLYVSPLPNTEYLPIYSNGTEEPSITVFESFINEYLDAVTNFFGVDKAYEIEKKQYSDGDCFYRAELRGDDARIRFITQRECVCFDAVDSSNGRLALNGNMVSVLESDTDEAIKEKLQSDIKYICAVFGKDYDSVKIMREYSYDQLTEIRIYLYTLRETVASPICSEVPMSAEYMTLTFHTAWGKGTACDWEGSKDEAFLRGISLFKRTVSPSEYYNITAKSKMISLKEAEKLLKKGYFFGGHSCPICMALQPKVDFSEYTCVDIEYVSDGKTLIPFYAFYKYIGETEYGIGTYAKTYVPAIEVTGLKEYFKNQKSNHAWHRKTSS